MPGWLHAARMGAVVLLTFNVHAADEVPDIRPGLWRVAVAIEIPNATGPDTGPMQYERCIVPENLRNLLISPDRGGCSVIESKMTTRNLAWTVRCSQVGMASTARGKIEFAGTRLTGTILTVSEKQPDLKITTRLSGRHVGACVTMPPATPATPAKPAGPPSPLPDYKSQ